MPTFKDLPAEIQLMILEQVVPQSVVLTCRPKINIVEHGSTQAAFQKVQALYRKVFFSNSKTSDTVIPLDGFGSFQFLGLTISWDSAWLPNLLLVNKTLAGLARVVIARAIILHVLGYEYFLELQGPDSPERAYPALGIQAIPRWLTSQAKYLVIDCRGSGMLHEHQFPDVSHLANLETITFHTPWNDSFRQVISGLAEYQINDRFIRRVWKELMRMGVGVAAEDWARTDVTKREILQRAILAYFEEQFPNEIDWNQFDFERALAHDDW